MLVVMNEKKLSIVIKLRNQSLSLVAMSINSKESHVLVYLHFGTNTVHVPVPISIHPRPIRGQSSSMVSRFPSQ